MQTFSPVIFEFFNPELVKEFCEHNQNWPKTKHCFDTFDSSDTFDSD